MATLTKGRPKKSSPKETAEAAYLDQLVELWDQAYEWTARTCAQGVVVGDAWAITKAPTSNPETWDTPPLRYWLFDAAARWHSDQARTLAEWGKPWFCVQCVVEAGEGRPGPAWAASKCFDHAWKDYLAAEAWQRAKTHGGKA